MNIEHKKTALDDNASIYSRNRATANKENIKNFTGKQKLRYFFDYYSKTAAVILLIIIGIAAILNETVFNRSTCVLSVGCINDIQIVNTEGAIANLEEYLQIENKNDYGNISCYNLDDYNMNMAFITHAATGGLDIILCSEEYFRTGCGQGMFADLRTVLPENMYSSLSDKMLEGQITETDMNNNVISRGETAPYGIDITDSAKFREYESYGEHPILCVVASSKNTENILKGISYYTSVPAE